MTSRPAAESKAARAIGEIGATGARRLNRAAIRTVRLAHAQRARATRVEGPGWVGRAFLVHKHGETAVPAMTLNNTRALVAAVLLRLA